MSKYWQRKEILFTPLGKKHDTKKGITKVSIEQFINCNGQLMTNEDIAYK